MLAVRLAITCAILVPYMLIRQPRDTIEIFVVALVAFGAGRLAVFAIEKGRKPDPPQR